MQLPNFVRRASLRVLAGGAACAVAVAVVGIVGERVRFGGDLDATRERIERDVRAEFATLSAGLEAIVTTVEADPSLITAIARRDVAATRALFDKLTEAESLLSVPGVAITVYGVDARPVAWTGRPADLLIGQITGSEALFVAPSPLGLRLTRVEPVSDPAGGDRRIASIAAEVPLPRAEGRSSDTNFRIATSVVPVPLRARFEGGGDGTDNAIVVTTASGDALAAVDVPASEIDLAVARWRVRVLAAEAAVVCAVLLLLSGPMLDWRRLTRRVGQHVGVTVVIVALLVLARAVAWLAVRLADFDTGPLASTELAGRFWLALASPADFLFTACFFGALVAVAASSFEQWRQSRQLRVRVLPAAGSRHAAAFVATQLIAGALVGAMVMGYEDFLRTRLSHTSFDLLHFSLHPWDAPRLAIATGLVILHAALLALAVLIFRVARSPWVIALDYRWMHALIPVLWAAPAIAVVAITTRAWEQPPVLPAIIVIAVAIAAAWRLRRYRAALEHASQAARLAAFFLALAAPSIFFYPSLVDAASRARRQLVETRYAPEVVNQRRNLQLQLTEAIAQIEAGADLAALVTAAEPVSDGPLPTEAAYKVWQGTVLEEQRLTSSVELHDARGTMIGRFALKLPQSGAPQIYNDAPCTWELFEEVSPFFAEERRLLHAGRSICVPGPGGGPTVVGSISLHLMLDYSNLSFISAQSPYVAMLRPAGTQPQEMAPRESVEFTVYGWSRRPLYVSGRDAWPLTEAVFDRVFDSRDPFWASVKRGDEEFEVYFLNDRGAIYALGYQRTGAFGHLISMAELVALAAATYVVLLIAGFVYGLIAARTPTSGRELLREVRASFYRKLFIAFVAAAVVPVLALAFVTRAYIADLMQTDLEMEATRTAASASRVVEDVGTLDVADGSTPDAVDDNLVVWLSRIIAQDVNIFDGSGLLASSERNLFVAGLLPTRTPGDLYRAIILDGRPSFVSEETVGTYAYLVAAAPVRVQNRDAILTVPLTLRQQEIETQTDELDRRVLLAVMLFSALGAAIGYSMAERIADPVNRLTKATGRIARGDLDARILASSSDEFRRLVQAFNQMAADLQRQRVELERSNRIAAWADMARQVAHDIKNPLTPIQLNAEHLRRVHEDRGAPLRGVLDECVNNILLQVKLLRSIASEFSSFASSPTARPTPSSLHDVVRDVIEPYRTGLAGRVAIDVDVPDALPALMIDKALLARALTNIIENALHAMPAGGSLRLSAARLDEQSVQLAIADTGIGMDREAKARIFEPYFSTRASGTGLGLTIAKRNVELNGGTIAIESERGKGTTVKLTLPVALIHDGSSRIGVEVP
jgi:signal transduction histidine kinase